MITAIAVAIVLFGVTGAQEFQAAFDRCWQGHTEAQVEAWQWDTANLPEIVCRSEYEKLKKFKG